MTRRGRKESFKEFAQTYFRINLLQVKINHQFKKERAFFRQSDEKKIRSLTSMLQKQMLGKGEKALQFHSCGARKGSNESCNARKYAGSM